LLSLVEKLALRGVPPSTEPMNQSQAEEKHPKGK